MKRLPFLIFGVIVTRIVSFFVPIWTKDEGYWWILGDSVARGGVLYQSAVDNKPALFIFIYALAIQLFGDAAFLFLHFLVLAGQIVILWVIHQLLKRTVSQNATFVGTACFASLQASLMSQEVMAANSENFMMPFAMFGFYLFVRSKKMGNLLMVGLITGIAFHIRHTAGILLPFFLIALLAERFSQKLLVLKQWIVLLFGFCLISAIVVFYFSSHGVLSDFLFWNFTLNRSYIEEPLSLQQVLWEGFWKTAVVFIAGFYPCTLAVKAFWNWKKYVQQVPLFFFFFLTMSVLIVVGFRFSHHYYLQLFPAIALLAGFAADLIEKYEKSLVWIRPRVLALCLLIPVVIFQGEAWYRVMQEQQEGSRPAIRNLSLWLKTSANPSDSLFVWGYYPEIYYFSGLSNASRYVETHYLTGQVRDSIQEKGFVSIKEKLWRYLWEDLQRHPPTWIADTSAQPVSGRYLHPFSRYPEMVDYIQKNYEPVTTIDGSDVYRRKR